MKVTVTKDKSGFTQSANVANTPTRIGMIPVPNGVHWILAHGTPLTMKLKDSNGVEIATSSHVIFGVRKPTADLPKQVDRLEYDPFAALDLPSQQNVNYQSRLLLSVPNGGVELVEGEFIEVWANADRVVDWTQSILTFDVEEVRN